MGVAHGVADSVAHSVHSVVAHSSVTIGNGYSFKLPESASIIFGKDTPFGYRVGINNPFTDVRQSDWFYDDVMFAYSHGLFSGAGAAEFSPDMSTTRGMIVTVLHRLESEPGATVESVFGDVADGKYYVEAIAWAAGERLT
jgi:hypothetical protein